MGLTMLVGGARSGKSTLAVEIGRRHDGPVSVVATAPVRHGDPAADDDMASRIAHHRAERPAEWITFEEPIDLAGAITRAPGLVLVDCLTLWTSNLMWAGHSDAEIRHLADRTATVVGMRAEPVVVVSNEVGLGVHPDTDLGRRYRDIHGWVNQRWAAAAEQTLLLVAGRALRLDDPWTLLASPPT